ncbi:MAG: HIT family protein [Sphingobacteriia bacterium]|jgi:histidine triad (HIT) family protein|nr:HIT family protein [Sphingobacteriia bacterium]
MASVFSKIVNGTIPSHKVAENEHFLAFLDAFPLRKGHVLVIPKVEIDYLFDLDEENYLDLMDFTRDVALAVKKAIPCKRISMQVIGLEVPHAHIHLIPINTMSDCNFSQEKLQFTKEEFEETAQKIAAQLT